MKVKAEQLVKDALPMLQIDEEVRSALAEGRPVVALESTVIAHGLPRPLNLELAREMEEIIRATGAVPATIAVLDGVPTIGLREVELERIATDPHVAKISTRDLGWTIARGVTAATTVAATAFLAQRAGIAVFATGGIGGVHRGAPLDVSADLLELHHSRMIVVCAGAKSILDLRATREALETLGVAVLGWRTAEFPAFHALESGERVDVRVEGAGEVGAIWRAHLAVEGRGSLLLCVPVPAEVAIPGAVLEGAIAEALRSAEGAGVSGKEITPYLLGALGNLTGGASLAANLALLRQNAAIAAEVACAIEHDSARPHG